MRQRSKMSSAAATHDSGSGAAHKRERRLQQQQQIKSFKRIKRREVGGAAAVAADADVATRRAAPLLYVNVNAAQNIIQKTLTHFCARVAHTHTHARIRTAKRIYTYYSERERDTRQGRFRPQFVARRRSV